MKERQAILLITYAFPPYGGVMVQRALSLARYLPEQGFDVHVLTARNPAVASRDENLARLVPREVAVHRCWTPEPPFGLRQALWKRLSRRGGGSTATPATAGVTATMKGLLAGTVRRILCPEPEVLWVPFALARARSLVKSCGIRLVLVTAPPFSLFLAGNALRRSQPGLKLISDFRDEWLDFYLKDFEYQNSEYTRRRAGEIERATIDLSHRVVAVTPSSLAAIKRRYPDQPPGKFACVPNGYDPAVFAAFEQRSHAGMKVVITHAGTAYKTSSPRFYLGALENLRPDVRARIETRFIGNIAESERALEQRDDVRLLGFMPQRDALRWMEETDYLLLTMTDPISLPGKLFEYLATHKPILAITPRGSEVERVLHETGAGWTAPPGDPEAIRAMILRACAGARLEPNNAAIRRYERPRLAAEYARVLWNVLEPEGKLLEQPLQLNAAS